MARKGEGALLEMQVELRLYEVASMVRRAKEPRAVILSAQRLVTTIRPEGTRADQAAEFGLLCGVFTNTASVADIAEAVWATIAAMNLGPRPEIRTEDYRLAIYDARSGIPAE